MLKLQCDGCGKLLYPSYTAQRSMNELPYAYLSPYKRKWQLFGRGENTDLGYEGTQHACSYECLKILVGLAGQGHMPTANTPPEPTVEAKPKRRRRGKLT